MDWKTFVIELLDKLAWPGVFVLTLVTLKKPFVMLIPLAKKLKFRDLEVEFGQKLKAVSDEAEHAFPELKKDRKASILSMADNMPNSAVLDAWDNVDAAAQHLILSRGIQVKFNGPTKYKTMGEVLQQHQLIEVKKAKLFDELRKLRNKVAHAKGFEVGRLEAIQYIELCFILADYLHGEADLKPVTSEAVDIKAAS